MAKVLKDFGPLYPAEKGLVEWLRAGNRDAFVVSESVPGENARKEVRIRAEFIRYLALGGCEDCQTSEKGLQVRGAYIDSDGTGRETKGLDLEGCTLRGDLLLVDCVFPDLVLMRGANAQSVFLNRSHFMNGLVANRLMAKGDVVLRNVHARGSVNLVGSKLGGDLVCENAYFDGSGRNAFMADGCTVVGALFWLKRARNNVWEAKHVETKGLVSFVGASFGAIIDDAASWPARGHLSLDRCRYGAFISGPVDATSRIDWLSRQDPTLYGEDFWPQPYEECARVLREMGHGADARAVLIEKERLQRKARRDAVARELAEARRLRAEAEPENGVRPYTDRVVGAWWALLLMQIWDGILGAVVGYGRKPQNAALWLLGFLVLGAVIFGHAGGNGAMKPNLPQVQRAAEWVNCREGGALRGDWPSQYHCYRAQPEAFSYPQFNALIYSADVLLPVVSLEMQSYWLPNDETGIGSWARVYLWFQIAAGWALTLLAVAGFSGLIKQDSK